MVFIKQIIAILYTVIQSIPTIKEYILKAYAIIKDLIWKSHEKKLDDQLNKAAQEAKELKDTTNLENLFGGHEPVKLPEKPQDKPAVEITTTTKLTLDEMPKDLGPQDEKKKPEVLTSNGSGIFFNVLGAAAGLTALNAIFGSKSARAASLGSISSSVDITQINRVQINGATRIGSKMLGLGFILFVSMNASNCTTAENRPNYSPKLWAGDSDNAAITRAQNNEMISASSREFDNYVALSYKDMACVYKTYVDNCEKFRSQIVDCTQVSEKDGHKLLRHAIKLEDENK